MPGRAARSLALVTALSLGLSSIGCGAPTEWVPVRYGAAVGSDHAADVETHTCASDCYENREGDADAFYRCLSMCPGIVRQDATTCEDPAPGPEAFCYTQWVEHEIPDQGGGSSGGAGDVIGQIFGAILTGLLDAAVNGKSHRRHRPAEAKRHDDRGVRSEARPEKRRSRDDGGRSYVPARRQRR